jgi:beta-N-acetylhexosaminidase
VITERKGVAGFFLAAGCAGLLGCAGAAVPAGTVGGPGAGTAALPALDAPLDREARRWVDRTLLSLSLREEVGQLVFQWIPGSYASTSSPEFEELEAWVVDGGIGGVAVSIGQPHAYAAKLNALQARAKVPLLVTSDFENGGPAMRLNHSYALPTLLPQGGGTSFPPTMAFAAIGEERFVHEYARITAAEARAVGVHLNFAPVLDVNSNPENPIINTRAFGEDPYAVARLGEIYLEGARAGGILTTAKHFPGHGDTRTDSHLELPEVTADRARLDRLELVPFRRAVDAGVDAVMTAHVSVPGVLGEGAPPATLSPRFMTELLREEMGFSGLLFTDALRMGAITDAYGGGEAAVLALQAGADVLLIPTTVEEAVEAVVEAVESGRIDRARVQASVRRILEAKARVGLHRGAHVALERVDAVVGAGAHLAFADSAADRSITLPRDRERLFPVDPSRTRRVLSVTYGSAVDLIAGRTFDDVLGRYVEQVERRRIDERTSPAAYDSLVVAVADADLVLVNAYVPPRAGAGSVAVPDGLVDFVRLASSAAPTAVLSFGNPYLLSAFPDLGTYLVAWGDREVSQRAGARAVVGATAISGTLPISLPPFHRVGDGERRERVPGLVVWRESEDALDQAGLVAPRWDGEAAGAGPGRGAPGGGTPPDPEDDPVVSPLEADPAAVGMSAPMLEALDSLLLRAIADGATPGAALAIGRAGELVRLRGYGRLDWDTASTAVTPASIYDLASLTKVVATTTATMILLDEGRLDPRARVVDYLPWWVDGDPRKRTVTVEQILLHRAGLPPFDHYHLEIAGGEAFREAIGAARLDYAPGTRTVYSDIGFMTMAFIVEEITGTTMADFLAAEVWEPLGLEDTFFLPDPQLLSRIAPTEIDLTLNGQLAHGVVHDENARAIGGVAGHAGLFSSARDLAVFAEMMLRGGVAIGCARYGADLADAAGAGAGPADGVDRADPASRTDLPALPAGVTRGADALGVSAARGTAGMARAGPGARRGMCGRRTVRRIEDGGPGGPAGGRPADETAAAGADQRVAMEGEVADVVELRLLRRETVERFTRRHDVSASRALGWDTPSERSSAGEFFTASAFGHTGFTGTSLWIDPELDLFVVLLTNRVNPSRANTLHIPLRRAVHDAAARAIMDRPVLRRAPCCEGMPPRR